MARKKKPVRAQRKYAHKAYVPPGYKNDVVLESAEGEFPPTPTLLLKNQKRVSDVLDMVSFQNGIHNHLDKTKMVPRVILERWSPVDLLRVRCTRYVTPDRRPIKKVALVPSTMSPIRTRRYCSANADTPLAPTENKSNKNKNKQRPNKKKKSQSTIITRKSFDNDRQREKQKTSGKGGVTKLSSLTLRNRRIVRAFRNSINNNIESDVDDNRPLTYFAKKTLPSRSTLMQSTALNDLAMIPHSSASNAAEGVDDITDGDFMVHIPDPVIMETIEVTSTTQNPNAQRTDEQGAIPKNQLYDFFIKIFDWPDTTRNSYLTDKFDVELNPNPTESIKRVNEWLTKNQDVVVADGSQDDFQFKIPARPVARAQSPMSSFFTASVVSKTANVSPGENILRNKCIAWHHKKLSSVIDDCCAVTKFCGKCSRCKVMFKSLQQDAESPIDIYDFRTSTDDRDVMFHETLTKISKDGHFFNNLRCLMTDAGRKILKAAILLNQSNTSTVFSSMEQYLLMSVNAILTKSNAAMDDPCTESDAAGCTTPGLVLLDSLSVQTPQCQPNALPKSPRLCPTIQEFEEGPIFFTNKILAKNPNTSVCGIVPPPTFKPPCVIDPHNFKVANYYLHRLYKRWSKATHELTSIRSTQGSKILRAPLFDGLEVDLVELFYAVQAEGGIERCQHVKEKWQSIAKAMRLTNVSKASKLESIYLKYLLEYNTLTKEERDAAMTTVLYHWKQREKEALERAKRPLWQQERMMDGHPAQEDRNTDVASLYSEVEECVTKGRHMNLATFKKLAKQVSNNFFSGQDQPAPEKVEAQYWSIVNAGKPYTCVYGVSVESTQHTRGFPIDQNNSYANHNWNLKNIGYHKSNVLSNLEPNGGISLAVLFGMCFTTSCWHKDPTALTWIEYLHEGAPKIWYSISSDQNDNFRKAVGQLCPWVIQNKDIWLPCDTLMISPDLLKTYGVTVQKHIQYPGEYVVVFPNTFCANINTGYTISEGVYFAPLKWILHAERIFLNLRGCCEPSLFSLEQLLIATTKNENSSKALQRHSNIVLNSLLCTELYYRQRMADRGIELMTPQVFLEQNHRASHKTAWQIQQKGECGYCQSALYLSKVVGVESKGLCAVHGMKLFENSIARREQLDNIYCILLISNEEIYNLLDSLKTAF